MPWARMYSLTWRIVSSPKWKTLAASTASASPSMMPWAKCSSSPTPPLAMKGVTDRLPAPAPLPPLAARGRPDGSVVVSAPGITPQRMIRVEGVWVPDSVAEAFANRATWKRDADAFRLRKEDRMKLMFALPLLNEAAAAAGNAKTQEEFDQIVGGFLSSLDGTSSLLLP